VDKRFYFWIPRRELAFFQSIVESTDNLARIRTERNLPDKALIVLMYHSSFQPEIDGLLRHYTQESGHSIETV